MQNFSYENEIDLHENKLEGETHFLKNGFAFRLVLTQRQTRTRKWAIALESMESRKEEKSKSCSR